LRWNVHLGAGLILNQGADGGDFGKKNRRAKTLPEKKLRGSLSSLTLVRGSPEKNTLTGRARGKTLNGGVPEGRVLALDY